jgi:hypothetical protein
MSNNIFQQGIKGFIMSNDIYQLDAFHLDEEWGIFHEQLARKIASIFGLSLQDLGSSEGNALEGIIMSGDRYQFSDYRLDENGAQQVSIAFHKGKVILKTFSSINYDGIVEFAPDQFANFLKCMQQTFDIFVQENQRKLVGYTDIYWQLTRKIMDHHLIDWETSTDEEKEKSRRLLMRTLAMMEDTFQKDKAGQQLYHVQPCSFMKWEDLPEETQKLYNDVVIAFNERIHIHDLFL